MKLVESILTENPCYTCGRKIAVKGLMIHSVGCAQPSAQVFVNNWNNADYDRACVHGFIDANTGTIHQTLPWDRRGWHAGSGKKGSANNTHIGVEMCEPGTIKYTGGANFEDNNPAKTRATVLRTYRSAVELFAMLCKQYSLDPLADGVVISHKEGCARGIASNHGDPDHLWSRFGLTMDGFRKDIKAAMGGAAGMIPAPPTASSGPSLGLKVGDIVNFIGTTHYTSANATKPATCKPGQAKVTQIYNGKHPYQLVNVKGGGSTVYGWVDEKDIQPPALAAVDKLAELGVINSPDYWKQTVTGGKVKYLDILLTKAAEKITKAGTRSATPEAGVDSLVSAGVIDTPDYWLENYNRYPSLGELLRALGGSV